MNLKNFYSSFFVRGWRPALGWVSVAAVSVSLIILPLINKVHEIFTGEVLANQDPGQLIGVLTVALGSATIRYFDKESERK